MNGRAHVWQPSLAWLVVKTLERKDSLPEYGIERQIERTSVDFLPINRDTLYPASQRAVSDTNLKAEQHQLTRTSRKQNDKENLERAKATGVRGFVNPVEGQE